MYWTRVLCILLIAFAVLAQASVTRTTKFASQERSLIARAVGEPEAADDADDAADVADGDDATPTTGDADVEAAEDPDAQSTIDPDTLPDLPGSELVGVGADIRRGVTTKAFTRSLFKAKGLRKFIFPIDDKVSYAVPRCMLANRMFDAKLKTAVYDNIQDKLSSLDVAVSFELNLGAFELSGSMDLGIDKVNNRKTVLTETSAVVQLYEIALNGAIPEDFDPQMLAEFKALPDDWYSNPNQFSDFIARYGTHYLRAVQVGGEFKQMGTTTTSLDIDNLHIAAELAFKFNVGIVAVKGSAKLKVDRKDEGTEFRSDFTYKATGGDPAVGGILAQAHASRDPDMLNDAFLHWLHTIKTIPAVYNYRFGTIDELLKAADGDYVMDKVRALQFAIQMYLQEGRLSQKNLIALLPNVPVAWSNYQRMGDYCISFLAVIPDSNTLVFSMTSSPGRGKEVGYDIEINSDRVVFKKHGQTVLTNEAAYAASPGSSVLLSSYLFCHDPVRGTLSYGRAGRIMTVYTDVKPELTRFWGLSSRGPVGISITALQTLPFSTVDCPKSGRHQLCNAPHGSCDENRQCQCEDGWKGYACQSPCPVANGAICSDRGTCQLLDQNSDASLPVCRCDIGVLGPSCEFDEIPQISIEIENGRKISDGDFAFSAPSERPLLITYKLSHTKETNAGLLSLIPQRVRWTYEEDGEPAVVLTQKSLFKAFRPGVLMLSVEVSYPHSNELVRTSVKVDVRDCTCSDRGRCNLAGDCVCNAGSMGESCEFNVVSHEVDLGSSPDKPIKDFFVRFVSPFTQAPAVSDIALITPCCGETFSITSHSVSETGFHLRVKGVNVMFWTQQLRATYKVTGLPHIHAQRGDFQIPASIDTVKRFKIRFPRHYHSGAPFVSVTLSKPTCTGESIGILQLKCAGSIMEATVKSVSKSSFVVEIQRVDKAAGWSEPFSLKWHARSLPARDVRQKGIYTVGKSATGPRLFDVFFKDVFRNAPTKVDVRGHEIVNNEVFILRVARILQDRFVVEIARATPVSIREGWSQNLKISWIAYPLNDKLDKDAISHVVNPRDLTYEKEVAYAYGDLPHQPVHLPPIAAITSESMAGHGQYECARLCLSNPECRAFTYSYGQGSKLEDCAKGQEDNERRWNSLCWLKGNVPTWTIKPKKCAWSATLPDPSRRAAVGTVFEVSAASCQTNGKLSPVECPPGALPRGMFFSSDRCPSVGNKVFLVPVLQCEYVSFNLRKEAITNIESCEPASEVHSADEYLTRLTLDEESARHPHNIIVCPSNRVLHKMAITDCGQRAFVELDSGIASIAEEEEAPVASFPMDERAITIACAISADDSVSFTGPYIHESASEKADISFRFPSQDTLCSPDSYISGWGVVNGDKPGEHKLRLRCSYRKLRE